MGPNGCRYRIDNCTSQTLVLRQKGCKEATDTLKPHSALHYAWDEPSLPHLLRLELPGRRVLGTFPLVKVNAYPWINHLKFHVQLMLIVTQSAKYCPCER